MLVILAHCHHPPTTNYYPLTINHQPKTESQMKQKTPLVLLILLILFSSFAQDKRSDSKKVTTTKSSQQKIVLKGDKTKIPVSDSIKVPVLDFKNTDIRDILRALGMQYNVNIYLDQDVKGEISLYLVDISVKDAIDFIVKRKNYDYTVKNNIVKVFKPEPLPEPEPPKPKVIFHIADGLLTVDFKEVPVDDIVRMFIDSVNLNVVLDGQSSKKISSRLSKISIEKAIKVIFETNGFDVNESDDIYYVAQQAWGEDAAKTGARKPRRMGVKVTPDKEVSIDVTNAALDDIVRNIIQESGINIIMYEKIAGTISAKCDSVKLDDLLRFILQNTKYTFWKDKGIYFIGSREMSQQKTTEIIPLRHIRAEEAVVSKFLPPKITKEAVIKYDSEHNSVIVIGSFDIVAEAKDFIEKIDKPIPQVLIEALVVEFNLSKIRSYGVSIFTGGSGDTAGDWESEQYLPTLNLKPGQKKTALILNKVLKHLGANKIVTLPKNFRSSIQALETADVVKVHSTPQIATINGNTASIIIGETRYYKLSKETISTTSNTQTNVIGTDERFIEKKFNTVLEVTPWVMAGGYVMVDIRPEFNIPRSGGSEDRPPTIDTRVIKSMVRLRDGQTIILGGQRQTENVVNSKGIPFLSSIPVLGYLFSSKTITKNETQMMIFLTPHVYYGDEGEVSPDDYFGDEINKMLEKHDPEVIREKKKEKREQRMQRRKERKKLKRINEKEPLNQLQTGREPIEREAITKEKKKKRKGFLWFGRKKDTKESKEEKEKKKKKERKGFLWFKKKDSTEESTKGVEKEKKAPREKEVSKEKEAGEGSKIIKKRVNVNIENDTKKNKADKKKKETTTKDEEDNP